jgi:hypothetical protein
MKHILWYHTTDENQHITNTNRTIRTRELRPKPDPLMRVQGATPQNVIHRIIITSATTQRLSNNISSTQVDPNSGVIRNQTRNHCDHRTVHHHVQKPWRDPDPGKYWKGIPAHISTILSTLSIHQQARLRLRIQIPTRSRFLRDAIDQFVAIYTNMSRNPHQPNHKLIRSQPPQSFLTKTSLLKNKVCSVSFFTKISSDTKILKVRFLHDWFQMECRTKKIFCNAKPRVNNKKQMLLYLKLIDSTM